MFNNFRDIEEIDRTVEWWTRRNYDLNYVITGIFGLPLPEILKDDDIRICIQKGIRAGNTYAKSVTECLQAMEITQPRTERVMTVDIVDSMSRTPIPVTIVQPTPTTMYNYWFPLSLGLLALLILRR